MQEFICLESPLEWKIKNKVRNGEYDFRKTDGTLISPSDWQFLIRPGMLLNLSLNGQDGSYWKDLPVHLHSNGSSQYQHSASGSISTPDHDPRLFNPSTLDYGANPANLGTPGDFPFRSNNPNGSALPSAQPIWPILDSSSISEKRSREDPDFYVRLVQTLKEQEDNRIKREDELRARKLAHATAKQKAEAAATALEAAASKARNEAELGAIEEVRKVEKEASAALSQAKAQHEADVARREVELLREEIEMERNRKWWHKFRAGSPVEPRKRKQRLSLDPY